MEPFIKVIEIQNIKVYQNFALQDYILRDKIFSLDSGNELSRELMPRMAFENIQRLRIE